MGFELPNLNFILSSLEVVPVLVGPLQALITILPGLLLALSGMIISIFKPRVMLNLLKILWRQKIGVVVIATCVGLGWTYLPGLIPFAKGSVSAKEEINTTWDMFRGSSLRTGYSGSGDDPANNTLNWAFDTEAQTFYSTPTILGNRVYATSVANIGPFNLNGDGAIYCLDADTGGIVWKQQPSGYRATFSSPSVSGKYLVVGEGLHLCSDAKIYCLDVENEGEILWQYTTNSHVESSPCIFEDKVYIGAGDDGYYCFKLDADANGEPQMVWHVDGKDYLDAEGSPLVIELDVDGKKSKRFYAGLGMGGKTLLCLNADTGAVIWKKPAPYPVFGPASFKDGRVYVGMGNGNFAEDAELAREAHRTKLTDKGMSKPEIEEHLKDMQPGGMIWCLDAITGEIIWEKKVPRTVLGAVIPGEEGLYYASRDGHMYLCTYDGKDKDKFQCNEAVVASPALGKEHVYFVTTGGNLFSLTSDNLELSWKSSLGQGALFISSPTLSRGHIYIGTDSSGLQCIGAPEVDATPKWTSSLGGSGNTGFSKATTLPEKGKYAWKFPVKNEAGEIEKFKISAPSAMIENNLFIPIADGARKGLLALELGVEKKTTKTEKWLFATPLGCFHSPVIADGKILVVDGKKGDASRSLTCLDIKTGQAQWKKSFPENVEGDLVLSDDDLLYVELTKGMLTCLDLSGKVIWQMKNSDKGLIGVPALYSSLISIAIYENNGGKALMTMDRNTGTVLWRKTLDVNTSPVIQGNIIFIGSTNGLIALNLTDGSELWQADTNGPLNIELSIYKKKIACVNQKNEIFLIDQRDGSLIKKLTDVFQKSPVLLCRKGLVYQGKTDLMAYSFVKGENKRWVKSKWLGVPTSPLIMSNSRIYYATDKKGLVCIKEK